MQNYFASNDLALNAINDTLQNVETSTTTTLPFNAVMIFNSTNKPMIMNFEGQL